MQGNASAKMTHDDYTSQGGRLQGIAGVDRLGCTFIEVIEITVRDDNDRWGRRYLMRHFDELLEQVRQRPGMYMGEGFELTRLESFFAGYSVALYEWGIVEEKRESLFPLPFLFFFEYVALHLGYAESTSGWRNMILERVHGDEKEGLALFFQLWDRFNQLAIHRCDRMVLTERNLRHHRTSRHVPRIVTGGLDYDQGKPPYQEALEVYRLELTDDAGYLLVINDRTNHVLLRRLYRAVETAEEEVQLCFGSLPSWQSISEQEIVLNGERVID